MTSTPIRDLRKGSLRPTTAENSPVLQADVKAMLRERHGALCDDRDYDEMAHDLIVVIRERVLQELQSYARHFIR